MKGPNIGNKNETFHVCCLEESQDLAHREETWVEFPFAINSFPWTPRDFKADGKERNPGSGKYFQMFISREIIFRNLL